MTLPVEYILNLYLKEYTERQPLMKKSRFAAAPPELIQEPLLPLRKSNTMDSPKCFQGDFPIKSNEVLLLI